MISPSFAWEFTVGNVVTIVGGIIAIAMLWQRVQDKLDVTKELTDKNTQNLDDLLKLALNTSVQQHERRILDMESAIKTMSLALESMRTDLGWIRKLLENQVDNKP